MKDRTFYINKLLKILGVSKLPSCHAIIINAFNEFDADNYKRSLKLFILALKIYGPNEDILNGISLCLFALNKYKYCKNFLIKSIKQYPDDPELLANLATLYYYESNHEKAIYYYSKAIEIDPYFTDAHINLIDVYLNQGSLFMAYISCLDLLKKEPDNAEIRELCNEIIINMALSLV